MDCPQQAPDGLIWTFKWCRVYERVEAVDVDAGVRTSIPVLVADGVAVAGDQRKAPLSQRRSRRSLD